MEDTIAYEKPIVDNSNTNANNTKDDAAAQYVECLRLVEGGNIRRFENAVAKFDFVQYESIDGDDAPTKSLLFYAIEHNDEPFVKVLLEMEVSLDKSYTVSRTIKYFN
ncbi:unnamed protein product [Rotaria magnacalcarata]|nr:unnamed protein product [Rotaria magnacalcarata]CAF4188534.1 unnamed protein product [Rotaria magnacalcarata]